MARDRPEPAAQPGCFLSFGHLLFAACPARDCLNHACAFVGDEETVKCGKKGKENGWRDEAMKNKKLEQRIIRL